MSTLELTPDAMRALAHRAVDAVVDHWIGMERKPAARIATRAEAHALLHEPVPRAAQDPQAVLERVLGEVMPRACQRSRAGKSSRRRSPRLDDAGMRDCVERLTRIAAATTGTRYGTSMSENIPSNSGELR
jgi:hypothetical protein